MTENRKDTTKISARVSAAEKRLVMEKAQRAKLSEAAYIRSKVLDASDTKTYRPPTKTQHDLSQLLAYVGQVGSQIKTLEKTLHNEVVQEELKDTLDLLKTLREVCLKGLGKRKLT